MAESTINSGKRLPDPIQIRKSPVLLEGCQKSRYVFAKGPPLSSTDSYSMSFDRSTSSLDDFSNFLSTQYLVFPVQNKNKEPMLIKFPEDLIEEDHFKEGSVWGSDTSLEEEAEIANHISGGIDQTLVLDGDDSPIQSPAPYLDSLA
ncbi:unnamed protein product, partial [Mesorhabditis spiculigera]